MLPAKLMAVIVILVILLGFWGIVPFARFVADATAKQPLIVGAAICYALLVVITVDLLSKFLVRLRF